MKQNYVPVRAICPARPYSIGSVPVYRVQPNKVVLDYVPMYVCAEALTKTYHVLCPSEFDEDRSFIRGAVSFRKGNKWYYENPVSHRAIGSAGATVYLGSLHEIDIASNADGDGTWHTITTGVNTRGQCAMTLVKTTLCKSSGGGTTMGGAKGYAYSVDVISFNAALPSLGAQSIAFQWNIVSTTHLSCPTNHTSKAWQWMLPADYPQNDSRWQSQAISYIINEIRTGDVTTLGDLEQVVEQTIETWYATRFSSNDGHPNWRTDGTANPSQTERKLVLPDEDQVVAAISSKLSLSHDMDLPIIEWHDMAYDAYQDIGYCDSNGIAYIKDAFGTVNTFGDIVESLMRTMREKGLKRAKALAQFYLGNHYGLKLTMMDTEEYIANARKSIDMTGQFIQRCSAKRSGVTPKGWSWSARYTVKYHYPYGKYAKYSPETNAVNALLQQFDAVLTPENLWDMVPFSFVIDWFTHTGDLLTSIGNLSTLRNYYEVCACIKSIKAQRSIKAEGDLLEYGWTVDGEFVEKYYDRYAFKYPLAPIPSTATEPGSPLRHSVEGAALVVSLSVK